MRSNQQSEPLHVSSEKGISVLVTIFIIVHRTKPIFRHEQWFDESSPYMKFGRNWVINDEVKVSICANWQVAAILQPSWLSLIRQYPLSILGGKRLMRVIHTSNFDNI